MKKLMPLMAFLLTFSTLTSAATTTSIVGSVQTHNCVTMGKGFGCRICCGGCDEDPMPAGTVFVVLTASKNFYLVPDIGPKFMARHLNEKVKIEGKLSADKKAIDAVKMFTWANGKWNKVWDQKMSAAVFEDSWMNHKPCG